MLEVVVEIWMVRSKNWILEWKVSITKVLGGFLEARILDFGFCEMSLKHYLGCFYVLLLLPKPIHFLLLLLNTILFHCSWNFLITITHTTLFNILSFSFSLFFLSRVSYAIFFKPKQNQTSILCFSGYTLVFHRNIVVNLINLVS